MMPVFEADSRGRTPPSIGGLALKNMFFLLLIVANGMLGSIGVAEEAKRSQANDAAGKSWNYNEHPYHVLVGATSSLGNDSRLGPEIGIGHLNCGVEGLCLEKAALVGMVGANEYMVAIGGGAVFYPATSWLELGLRTRGHGISGYQIELAVGSIVMPYVSLVHTVEDKRTYLEAGVTAKWILLRFH